MCKKVNIFDGLYDKIHPWELQVEAQWIRVFHYESILTPCFAVTFLSFWIYIEDVKPGYYLIKREFYTNDKQNGRLFLIADGDDGVRVCAVFSFQYRVFDLRSI